MQIGEFYVIKGYGGYYTPSLYKDHYQKIDIDEYKKQDRKWSKESCECLQINIIKHKIGSMRIQIMNLLILMILGKLL